MASPLEKNEQHETTRRMSPRLTSAINRTKLLWIIVITALLLASWTYYHGVGLTKSELTKLLGMGNAKNEQQLVRKYHLQTGTRWMNPGMDIILHGLIIELAKRLTNVSHRWRSLESDVRVQRTITVSNPDS